MLHENRQPSSGVVCLWLPTWTRHACLFILLRSDLAHIDEMCSVRDARFVRAFHGLDSAQRWISFRRLLFKIEPSGCTDQFCPDS